MVASRLPIPAWRRFRRINGSFYPPGAGSKIIERAHPLMLPQRAKIAVPHVTPVASNHSISGTAYLRVVPTASRSAPS